MTRISAAAATLLVVFVGLVPALEGQDRRTSGGAALAALGRQFSARVVSVADGDSFEVVTSDRRRVRIRLEGIDCPERGEPFSNVARNFTRQLAFDESVDVDVRDVDRYGRLVARVTADGKDLSVELVSAGLASHYTVFSFDPKLEAAEKRAKKERRGMWVDGARSPSRSREPAASSSALGLMSTPDAEGPYFGNVRSHVYHAKVTTEIYDTTSHHGGSFRLPGAAGYARHATKRTLTRPLAREGTGALRIADRDSATADSSRPLL